MHVVQPANHEQRLPQEIFDCVIDHLHDSADALRVCALVSSAWRASARKHLFRRITLGPSKSKTSFFSLRAAPSPCARLFECIHSGVNGSGVAPYIRELHLHEGVSAHEWLARERVTLTALLRSLSNLRRLEISRAAAVHISWKYLPVDLKAALEEHVLKLASLTELRLSSVVFEDFGEVRGILRECRFLRVLEVGHMMLKDESLEVLAPSGEKDGFYYASDSEKGGKIWNPTPLDTLVIGPRTSTAFIAFLLHETSPIAVDAIIRLTASISGSFPEFARLLHASVSVEYLELTLMNDVSLQEYWKLPDDQRFDLSQVPLLRSLKVNIDVLQKMDDPLPWLGALLGTGIHAPHPKRHNKVETVWIVYSIYLPSPYMDRSTSVAIFDSWREIDAILCGGELTDAEEQNPKHGAYESLKTVTLDFMLENPIGFGIAPRFLKELVLESPGLERKDILRVHAFDTSK